MTSQLTQIYSKGTALLKEAQTTHLKIEQQLLDREAQFSDLQKEVGEAKTREAWQPEIKKVLEALQRSEHERAVGAFERLLSALLNDILPGKRQVLLDLSTSAGLSSLDISLLKGEHIPKEFFNPQTPEGTEALQALADRTGLALEDVLNGSGGAVANVLSMGLRMITLIRSGQRRFLVLDEADCWIKPSLVGAFAKVVQQAAQELGIQVLMISHHDESFFIDIPHRLNIRQNEKGLTSDWAVDGEKPHWDKESEGFRSLALFGFQAHEATYLPLSPGVTLLYGENDVGKSSIVTALRAVFYGETSDSLIRHEQASTKVMIEMENEKVLTWERNRKPSGKDKVKGLYTLKHAGQDNPLHETAKAKGVPDWLVSETGMGLVDDLDVQIGNQKDPVFLLTRSGSQRAKALAVGTDSGYVQIMMDLAKEEISEAKTIIKRGEKQLEVLHREIQIKQNIKQINLTSILDDSLVLQEKLNLFEEHQVLFQKWNTCLKKAEALRQTKEVILPKMPDIVPLKNHYELFDKWNKNLKLFNILKNLKPLEVEKPKIKTNSDLRIILGKWDSALNKNKILEALKKVKIKMDTPQFKNNSNLHTLLLNWKNAQKQSEEMAQQIKNMALEIKQKKNELQELYPKICPTCQQNWPHSHTKKEKKETTTQRHTRIKPE